MFSWSHLGPVLASKMNISCGSCFLSMSPVLSEDRVRSLKMAQDGPRWAARRPKMAPIWPQMAPRGLQDGPKTAPSRILKRSYLKISPSDRLRSLKMAQDRPKMAPKGTQEGPKRAPYEQEPPGLPQETPRTSQESTEHDPRRGRRNGVSP